MNKSIFLFIALIMALLLGGYGAYKYNQRSKLIMAEQKIATYFKSFKAYKENIYLPDIIVLNNKGKDFNLKEANGKFTVLNIWATWCAPCVEELPSLKSLKSQLSSNNWQVMAISIDSMSMEEKVKKFISNYDVAEIAGFFDYKRSLQKYLNIQKLPVTFIISDKGKVLYKIEGKAKWNNNDIINFLHLVEIYN